MEMGPPWQRTITSPRIALQVVAISSTASTASSRVRAVCAPMVPPVVRPIWATTMSAPASVIQPASAPLAVLPGPAHPPMMASPRAILSRKRLRMEVRDSGILICSILGLGQVGLDKCAGKGGIIDMHRQADNFAEWRRGYG